ncbi:hypothetical protein DPEC_G00101700 [Dallia pectoralis]|uniref:Uncharacterized protein n=1 Tax=Dallia pectoralis TaxID=75939 RepID=A0ACC2GXA2_DALPE|nr:hypothetical protein DPEC_G00101700 [Dallia pectoralis]
MSIDTFHQRNPRRNTRRCITTAVGQLINFVGRKTCLWADSTDSSYDHVNRKCRQTQVYNSNPALFCRPTTSTHAAMDLYKISTLKILYNGDVVCRIDAMKAPQ